jgi:hypothetical protein
MTPSVLFFASTQSQHTSFSTARKRTAVKDAYATGMDLGTPGMNIDLR